MTYTEDSLVSVIVPVFNAEKYVRECLASLCKQSHQKIEIIVINDGSTDRSLDVCREFEHDARVRIVNKVNEGLSKARYVGMIESRGEFICTVDADDFVEPNFIHEHLYSIVTRCSDISVCPARHHNGDSYADYGFDSNVMDVLHTNQVDLENKYFEIASAYYCFDSWNKMYRKSFLESTGVQFSLPREFNGTDLLFNHLLLLHCPKIARTNSTLYHYRILETSRVRRKNKRLQQGFNHILSALVSEAEKKGYSPVIYSQFSLMYVNFCRASAQDELETCSSITEARIAIEEFFELHRSFVQERPMIKLNPKNSSTWSLKLFALAIVLRSPTMVYAYCAFRKRMILWSQRHRLFNLI